MRRLTRHTSVKLRHFWAGFLLGIGVAVITVSVKDLNPQELIPIHTVAVDSEEHWHHQTDSINKHELKNPRVMCMFYKMKTVDILHQLQTAKTSWTNKCVSVLLSIDRHNGTIPALSFDRLPSWVKISQSKFITALRYIYGRHFQDADWFFISRGIPYVLMENLHDFLSKQDDGSVVYWGHKVKKKALGTEITYPDEFAGVVLSKRGLHRLGTKGEYNRFCNGVDASEGVMFAMCMSSLGIQFGDARDGKARSRFLLHNPGFYLDDNLPPTPWFEDLELKSSRPSTSVSSSLISFGRAPVSRYPGYTYTIYNLTALRIPTG